MLAAIGAGLSVLGTAITGFFGFKEGQANVLGKAVDVIADVSASNAQREHAIALIIAAEANSGYWLAAIWRPIGTHTCQSSWWPGGVCGKRTTNSIRRISSTGRRVRAW